MTIKYPTAPPTGAYVYLFTVDGVPRYVGKGVRNRLRDHERSAKKGRTPWHKFLAKALREGADIHVSIPADGLTDAEARDLEVTLIARHGRKLTGEGSLMNLAAGGDGLDSEGAKIAFNTPEVRKTRQEAGKIANSDDAKRKAHSEYMREYMARPEIREWQTAVNREILSRPGVRAAKSREMKDRMLDPEFRDLAVKALNSPETRRKNAVAVRAATKTKAYRDKMSAINKTTSNRLDVKEKKRAAASSRWENPEYREKMRATSAERNRERGAAARYFGIPYKEVTKETRLRYLRETGQIQPPCPQTK